jgi:hypothetical protein
MSRTPPLKGDRLPGQQSSQNARDRRNTMHETNLPDDFPALQPQEYSLVEPIFNF